MVNKHVIIIPIHRPDPGRNELLSFKQCFKVLYRHPIKVVAPKNLDVTLYKEAVSEFDIIFIDELWQSSLRQYNRLKISSYFYDLFANYDFLLTYELDSWVFKDELDYWTTLKFDYIGAPWFKGFHEPTNQNEFLGVGNSGFSIRKVSSSIRALKELRMVEVLETYKNFNWKGIILRLPQILSKLSEAIKEPSTFEKNYTSQEDFFWCLDMPKRLKNFSCKSSVLKSLANFFIKKDYKIAPVELAIKFSFEINPHLLYKINNENLPFGCHGWEKYEEFWKEFIPKATN